MQLALIPPHKYLKTYQDESDLFMCLAPFLEDPAYFEFFVQKAREGKYVIMDNGAAEGKLLTGKEQMQWALALKPHEVIAPDYLHDGQKTRGATEQFLDEHYDELAEHNIAVNAVVQGATLEDALCTLDTFEADGRIEVISLPFAGLDFFSDFNVPEAINKTQRNALSRLWFTKTVYITKPAHLLGLYQPLELSYHNDTIRSCDTSLPFKMTLVHDLILGSGIGEKPDFGDEYFTSSLDNVQSLAAHNIRELQNHAKNKFN